MVPGPGLSRGYIRAVSLNFCHLEPENPLPSGLTWWFVDLETSGTVGGDLSSCHMAFTWAAGVSLRHAS